MMGFEIVHPRGPNTLGELNVGSFFYEKIETQCCKMFQSWAAIILVILEILLIFEYLLVNPYEYMFCSYVDV